MYKRNADPLRNWKINICIHITICMCVCICRPTTRGERHTWAACVRDDTFENENEIGFDWYTNGCCCCHRRHRCRHVFVGSCMNVNWLYWPCTVVALHDAVVFNAYNEMNVEPFTCFFDWSPKRETVTQQNWLSRPPLPRPKTTRFMINCCTFVWHIIISVLYTISQRCYSYRAMLTENVRFILVISINRISLAH